MGNYWDLEDAGKVIKSKLLQAGYYSLTKFSQIVTKKVARFIFSNKFHKG
jgi:hypothetical protein